MKSILYTCLLISPFLFISSCKKNIEGCMDSSAINYNSEATTNNNSCLFDSDGDGIYDSDEIFGCTDSLACNFDINATDDNSNCVYSEPGYDCAGHLTAQVGDEFQGGILIYIDVTGEHGLIAAYENLPGLYEWGCYGINLNSTNNLGYENSLYISQNCETETGEITAAQAAIDYENEGYLDWYLPNKSQLGLLHLANEGGIINFDGEYWSSTQVNIDKSWMIIAGIGGGGECYSHLKYSLHSVYPIRSF